MTPTLTAPAPVTPAVVEELDQLKKQNALLMRTLLRVKAERDALAKQLTPKSAPASCSPEAP